MKIQQQKINLQEIKKFFDEHPTIKKTVYVVIAVGAFYLAGRIANGMATAVRGFKNLNSAIGGK